LFALALLSFLIGSTASSVKAIDAASSAVIPQPEFPTKSTLPWLHVQGNFIVNENGSAILLRGVSIEDQDYMSAVNGHIFGEADIVNLVRIWHVNAIRVPIFPDLWKNNPNYAERFLDPIVTMGSKYGVYIILGWHAHGNPITGQTDLPAWKDLPPFHGNPYDPNLTLATSFWNSVGERYENNSVVIYSIFDEPAYITWQAWRPVAQQLVGVIQSHNPRALVLVSGVSWAYDLRGVTLDPVEARNVVYETHPYPGDSTVYGAWDTYFGYLASRYPIFAGEWGYQPGDADRNLDATAMSYGVPLLSYMDEHNISWTAWCWSSNWAPLMLNPNGSPTEFGQLVISFLASHNE